MRRNTQQSGFTLVELVVVIIILGILSATAIPKFVDLSSEAKTAALGGVAGAINSAMAINYAACAVKNHNTADGKCVTVSSCATVKNTLASDLKPADYTITGTFSSTTNGTNGTCTLTQTNGGATEIINVIAAGI